MRKAALILLGIILIGACAGYATWRVQTDPGVIERYEKTITGRIEEPAPDTSPSGEVDDGDPRSATARAKKAPRAQPLKLFEIILDLANVIVGLIGIGLAIYGMRMRAEANEA